jgi:hypothetical protein
MEYSSQDEDEFWSVLKSWRPPKGWKSLHLIRIVKMLGSAGLALSFFAYVVKELWLPAWYHEHRERARESEIYDAVYDRLVKGPQIELKVKNLIPRDDLRKEIEKLITPSDAEPFYPVIIGEHGTGKTSLVLHTINNMKEPKGVVYIDCPARQRNVSLAQEIRSALVFKPSTDIGPDKMPDLLGILREFSSAAVRFSREHGRMPVLIFDNVNRVTDEELETIQDYAKLVSDRRIATIVFVSSEGHVPKHMEGM